MINPILVSLALLTPSVSGGKMPLVMQAPADYMYTFRTSGDGGDRGTSGTVRVHGDRMRIDIDRITSDHNDGEYMIVADNGSRIFNVHPDKKTIEEIDAAHLENVIGIALRGVSSVTKFQVMNASVTSQRVGTGEAIVGHATDHVRIRESYDVKITALGFDGGTEHTTVVTDYWVAPGLSIGHNPLLALIENAQTAMAQSDRDYVAKQRDARANMLKGAVLKSVSNVTTSKHGDSEEEKRKTMEVTSLKQGAQAPGLFELPKGYEMKSGWNFTI